MNAMTWIAGRAAADTAYLMIDQARDERVNNEASRRAAGKRPLAQARALLAAGDHEGALTVFEREIAAGNDPEGLAHLGRTLCLLNLGREDDAADALQDAGDAIGLAEVPLRLARVCAAAGREADALKLVGVALASEPRLAARVAEDKHLARLRDHPMFLQMVGQL